uniref:Prothymosin alpha-like n=1 Tax=Strongyloides venezuelensis TaxID=75913 RepID=A0A0K0FJE9_STRVS
MTIYKTLKKYEKIKLVAEDKKSKDETKENEEDEKNKGDAEEGENDKRDNQEDNDDTGSTEVVLIYFVSGEKVNCVA